jgi:isopentenyl-diphosphate delta-isomerase
VAHDNAEETRRRKEDHLRIPLERDVQSIPNPWDHVHLRHEALPSIARDDVDLSTSFLGHKLAAPVQITGMTGGATKAREINDQLAAAAAAHGVAMGVGSQRAAIENPELADTYSVILDHEVPLRFANFGLPQIIAWGESAAQHAETAIEMIDGHALCIHLNFLQEAVMPEGDTNAAGGLEALQSLCSDLKNPVIVKETGAGVDGETAERLIQAGAAAIDVGGLGGTSFAAVEHHRANDAGEEIHARMGKTYWDWGTPTPECVMDVRDTLPDTPIVATGGLRHGLDALRALTLGADLAGFAGTFFRAASAGQATQELSICLEELKTGIFLSGSARVTDLRPVPK